MFMIVCTMHVFFKSSCQFWPYSQHTLLSQCSFKFLGLAYRLCFQNTEWDIVINITQCQSIELIMLNNILNEHQEILDSNTNNNTRDLTVLFDVTEVKSVSKEVNDLTNISNGIVPNDIVTTNNIVNSLIRYVTTYVIIQ